MPDFFRAAGAAAVADDAPADLGARAAGADVDVRPARERDAAGALLAAAVSEAAADPVASAGSAQAGEAAPSAAAPIPSATARPPTRPIKADACIPGHLPTHGRGTMANEQPRPSLTISRLTLRENTPGIRFRCQVIFCQRTGQAQTANKAKIVTGQQVQRRLWCQLQWLAPETAISRSCGAGLRLVECGAHRATAAGNRGQSPENTLWGIFLSTHT